MSAPFKMKSPLLHWGRHPSKKDGHKRSDHKAMRAAKKLAKAAGKSIKSVAGLVKGRK